MYENVIKLQESAYVHWQHCAREPIYIHTPLPPRVVMSADHRKCRVHYHKDRGMYTTFCCFPPLPARRHTPRAHVRRKNQSRRLKTKSYGTKDGQKSHQDTRSRHPLWLMKTNIGREWGTGTEKQHKQWSRQHNAFRVHWQPSSAEWE